MFLSIHSSKDISNVDNTFSLEKQLSFTRKRFLILLKTIPKQPKDYSKAILKQKHLWAPGALRRCNQRQNDRTPHRQQTTRVGPRATISWAFKKENKRMLAFCNLNTLMKLHPWQFKVQHPGVTVKFCGYFNKLKKSYPAE